jgi:hypothetical protein
MPIHCLKCKTRTGDDKEEEIVTRTGKRMLVAKCIECGIKKHKFLPKLSVIV